MAVAEHNLSYMLRNSGEILDEVQHRDVVLQRRDGEDLYLALRSRERGVRESLGILARLLRRAVDDDDTRPLLAKWLSDALPWTSFLPSEDREQFLIEFTRTSAACVDVDTYEPLVRSLEAWKATAEVYANPEILKLLDKRHRGHAVSLTRPTVRGRKR